MLMAIFSIGLVNGLRETSFLPIFSEPTPTTEHFPELLAKKILSSEIHSNAMILPSSLSLNSRKL